MTDSKIARRRPDPCMHTPKMFAARLGLAVGASLCLWSSALGNDAGVARLQSPIDYWNGSVTLTETATMAVPLRERRASDYETMPQAALSVDMHPKGIYALTVIDMGSTSVPLQPCHSTYPTLSFSFSYHLHLLLSRLSFHVNMYTTLL